MRDPSLVASEADIRQQAIKGGEVPLATNAVQQIASYLITSSARAGVLPDRMSTPPANRCRRSSAAQARTRRPRQPAEAATP